MTVEEKTGVQRRAHTRVDLFTKVKVVDKETRAVQEVVAGNVSKGGIFLRSNRPLPKGKRLELEIDLDGNPVTIDEAEVVWSKPFEPISVDGALPGMGICFKSAREESLERIGRFIDEALAMSLLPDKAPAAGATPPSPKTESPPSPPPKIEAAKTASSSPGVVAMDVLPAASPSGQLKVKLKAAPTPPPPVLSAQEVPMENLSAPPSTGKRVVLFASFVITVAIITFILLLVFKPFEQRPLPEPDSTAITTTRTEPTPPPNTQAVKTVPESPAAATASQPVAEKQPLPQAAEEPPKPAADIKPPAALPPAPEKPTPVSEKAPAKAAVAARAELSPPVFRRSENGWLMELAFPADAKSQHFTLKSPPRLAIDILGVRYPSRQRTFEAPTPFVQRVRVGVEPEKVRLVLDFNGEKLPLFSVQKSATGMTIHFPD